MLFTLVFIYTIIWVGFINALLTYLMLDSHRIEDINKTKNRAIFFGIICFISLIALDIMIGF